MLVSKLFIKIADFGLAGRLIRVHINRVCCWQGRLIRVHIYRVCFYRYKFDSLFVLQEVFQITNITVYMSFSDPYVD